MIIKSSGLIKGESCVEWPFCWHPLKGGRGFLMSPPLSGISGLSVWSHYISCLVLLSSPVCRVCNFCKIWVSEKPWGDPVWLTGLYKPSINKSINNNNSVDRHYPGTSTRSARWWGRERCTRTSCRPPPPSPPCPPRTRAQRRTPPKKASASTKSKGGNWPVSLGPGLFCWGLNNNNSWLSILIRGHEGGWVGSWVNGVGTLWQNELYSW